MAAKPLPQLRKPSAAAAASFVESQEAPSSAPLLEVVRSSEDEKGSRKAKGPEGAAKAARRRMTLYLSKATAKALKLHSFNQERDMSDIVEEVLAKHFKARAP